MKRTPLKRITPLRRTPEPGTGQPSRRTAKTRSDTGPSPKVRALVLERDGYKCVACGISIQGRLYSLQHRVARGMGGTSRKQANSPVNLITLCGSATSPGCHRLCEDRDPGMRERGYWLWSRENPAEVPVMLFSEHDSGITVWLADDGTYRLEPPEGAVA